MTKAKTRNSETPSGQLRFVLDPSLRVVCDLKGVLPVDEAVWLKASKTEVQRACDEGLFKQLDPQAEWAKDLPDRVSHALRGRLVEHLSLARRSGAIVPGFEKVKASLESGKLAFLMQASDAAIDGREKLSKVARHLKTPDFALISGGILGLVMGREWQVHLGVKSGGLADQLLELCRLIEEYDRT